MSWEPTTYRELQLAESDGRLVESASLELKSTINNAKLARSLASLAVNGGTLLIGVADDGSIAPTELEGWTEKVAQVAWARVAPGLSPRVWTLPDPDTPSIGVVVVAVDASPQAPHMADDRYPARLGTTTGYLSDPDIERLMERRQLATRDASAELAGYRTRDPDPGGPTAHAFVVAVPRLADPDLLDTTQQTWLMNELILPVASDARITSGWAPRVGSEISTHARRVDGAAFTWGLNADRTPDRADSARAAGGSSHLGWSTNSDHEVEGSPSPRTLRGTDFQDLHWRADPGETLCRHQVVVSAPPSHPLRPSGPRLRSTRPGCTEMPPGLRDPSLRRVGVPSLVGCLLRTR